MPAEKGLLLKLAQLYGIQSAYYGSDHKRHPAQTESILAILKSLGAPITSPDDLPSVYRSRIRQDWEKIIEPVTIAWDGILESVTVRLPGSISENRCSIDLFLENGTQFTQEFNLSDISVQCQEKVDGITYYQKNLAFTKNLPYGYHRLKIEAGGKPAETLILSAPYKAYLPEPDDRAWGVFIPLYSLHSRKSWGAGNFSDLRGLVDWTGNLSGKLVGTLPLLASFLGKPYEPSPYLPVSKLFWNEFYIDVTRAPELSLCPDALKLMESLSFQKSIRSLEKAELVDYFQLMAIKRTILEELSLFFFSSASVRRQDFNRFINSHPEAELYARFRATMEKQDKTWRHWHSRLKSGSLKAEDYDEKAKQYHLYVQWLAQEQLLDVTRHAVGKATGLYLDLPLGTHPDGFDTWYHRNIFVDGVSVGAPPDKVFTRGQNWAFPPLHPDKIRESGYAYVIACLRQHMQHARTLRIDHIMGLHRLFFIPEGLKPDQGVYVRYHPQELYAILSIESHRHHSIIVGEDLGIVPGEVCTAMNRHGIRNMWVMYYELAGESKSELSSPKPNSVASLNTHDMPPFASFWSGRDITERERIGIISTATAHKDKIVRANTRHKLLTLLRQKKLITGRDTQTSVLKACLRYLASGSASIMLINLEDLWLETHAQNIPSTTTEHPNWRQKAHISLQSLCQMPHVATILEEVNRLRSGEEIKHDAGKTEKRHKARFQTDHQ